MPELKTYTDDSPKSGYYILANVGGSHPITIQVTDLGGQILQKAGYSGGDNVPTKVVWSMFDVGILYTSGTINDPPEVDDNPDETFQQLGVANKLTAQEQDQLLNYLNEYTGPNQTEVNDLRETLQQSSVATQERITISEDTHDDLDRISTLYKRGDLTNQEYELLKSRILDEIPSKTVTHKDSTDSADINSAQERLQFDLAQELWNIIPEDKYNNNMENFALMDKTSDDGFLILVHYIVDSGFTYACQFRERAHEERMFKLLDDSQWEIMTDNSDASLSPSVTIKKTGGEDGFRNELSNEFVNNELDCLLKMIQTVYEIDPSNLALD